MDHRRLRRSSLVAAGLLALAVLAASHARANSPPCPYGVSAGVATDIATGLGWQVTASATAFPQGLGIMSCTGMGTGWRLPTILELQTIVHEGRTLPAIDGTSFAGGVPFNVFFWSSTPFAADATQAWGVDFDKGDAVTAPLVDAHSVRCVHGG